MVICQLPGQPDLFGPPRGDPHQHLLPLKRGGSVSSVLSTREVGSGLFWGLEDSSMPFLCLCLPICQMGLLIPVLLHSGSLYCLCDNSATMGEMGWRLRVWGALSLLWLSAYLTPPRNAALTGQAVQPSSRHALKVPWQAAPVWAMTSSAGSPASLWCTMRGPCGTILQAWWRRTR